MILLSREEIKLTKSQLSGLTIKIYQQINFIPFVSQFNITKNTKYVNKTKKIIRENFDIQNDKTLSFMT